LDKKLDMLVERTTVEEVQTEIEVPTADGKERSMPMTSNEKNTVTTKLIKVEDY
jgi:ABC-type phosphate transport system auxiliary subunit